MRMPACLLLLCCAAIAPAQPMTVATIPSAAKSAMRDSAITEIVEFKRLAESWRQAYNSGDAHQLAPMYAEEADYLSAHVEGYIAHGRDAVIANFQRGMAAGGHIDTVIVLSANASCDLGTLVCYYRATNAGQTVEGRNLLVSKKIDGKWLIVTHATVIQD